MNVLLLRGTKFIPTFGRPPELAEVQESLAVLSQLVDLENYLFLAIDQMKITTWLEREFQRELQPPGDDHNHRAYL